MDLILSPELQMLNEEIAKLRVELSMLVSEHDELKYVICVNIETEYLLKLGTLEYRIYQAYCKYLRLRRKIELIRAKLNRQERVDLAEIEKALDQEFQAYQNKLDDQMRKMNEALKRGASDVLSDKETVEFKRMYRQIVKRLHPDLHPNITAAQLELFLRAVEAYQNGDLNAMRIIYELADADGAQTEQISSIEKAYKTRDHLLVMVQDIQNSIREIKSSYPYTLKVYLDNEKKLQSRKEDLESLLKDYEDSAKEYEEYLTTLLR